MLRKIFSGLAALSWIGTALTGCGSDISTFEDAPDSLVETKDMGCDEPDAVGLGLYFFNGQWNPDFASFPDPERPTALHVVDGYPRFLQELYIVASVPTTLEDGLDPLIESSEFSDLNWNGIDQVSEDWRVEFSGFSYQHAQFFRNAKWMNKNSEFTIKILKANGKVLETHKVQAGKDDKWKHQDDAFERRFVARTLSTGCVALGDCTNPEAIHLAQAAVQLAKALHPNQTFEIPPQAAKLELRWSEFPGHKWVVPIVHDTPGDIGYGLNVILEEVAPPERGFYLPGEAVNVRMNITDGQGERLFPLGQLASYEDVQHRRAVSQGLRYLSVVDTPMLYNWHKDPQSEMETFLGGPVHLMTTVGTTPITPFSLFQPQIQSADLENDGWIGLINAKPDTPLLLSCLLDPTSPACDVPPSDIFTYVLPADAPLGTYVAGVKTRREWGGEPIAKAASIPIQVGSMVTEFPGFHVSGMDNACAKCHVGRASLPVAAHGFPGVNKVGPECMTCHTGGYYFEPDAGIDVRLRFLHQQSNRLDPP